MALEVLRFADQRGRLVQLWDDRWRHILHRHSELVEFLPDLLAEIGTTVVQPDRVTRDAVLERGENYYRSVSRHLMLKVCAVYRPTSDGWVGEILTAHLTGRVKNGEIHLWP